MAINLKEIQRQSWEQTSRDGLMEVAVGLVLLAFAVVWLNTALFVPFVAFLPFLSVPVMDRIRKRYTYPRIGRVKVPKQDPKMTVGIFIYAIAALALVATSLYFVFGEGFTTAVWYRSMPMFAGLIMLGAFTYLRSKTGSQRYVAFAVLCVASAFVFSLQDFGASMMANLTAYLSFIGCLFVLIGLATFITFVKRTPIAGAGHG